jgi:EAL domain-containing protein (putative c-di-GMP-specific phosphodiesterase class I)
VISLIWLVALAAGVMARGGRVHWIGRAVVMGALALPIIRAGSLDLVEITEETLVGNTREVLWAGDALREQGARLAVDDIGAGYSGLRQLATLRPAYLKLDRGLVQGLEADPARASLVAAMTSYALATDALLIAEGVETEAELATLRDIGVRLIQGFLIARPAAPWPTPAAVSAARLAA